MIPCFSLAVLVITVWINPAHPVRYEIGLYNPNTCQEIAEEAFKHRKNKKQHMELSCEPTDRMRA